MLPTSTRCRFITLLGVDAGPFSLRVFMADSSYIRCITKSSNHQLAVWFDLWGCETFAA